VEDTRALENLTGSKSNQYARICGGVGPRPGDGNSRSKPVNGIFWGRTEAGEQDGPVLLTVNFEPATA